MTKFKVDYNGNKFTEDGDKLSFKHNILIENVRLRQIKFQVAHLKDGTISVSIKIDKRVVVLHSDVQNRIR